MAETPTPSTPANNASWSAGLSNLLTTGTNIFTGYTNAQTAKANTAAANAAAKAAAANAQSQQSSVVKYVLIAVAVVVTVGLVIFLVKRK